MQTRVIRTFNAYHLGDNLVHLHFLRKVALANPELKFHHFAQWHYLNQLRDLLEGVPNLSLSDFNQHTPSDSINAWRGDKQFWYEHPDRYDFVKFHLEAWFPYLCERMKVENPVKEPKDMLFDYPKLLNCGARDKQSFGVMIINSPPMSGQFQGYRDVALDMIYRKLIDRGQPAIMTGTGMPTPIFSATEIGNLSLDCHTILMVSTGPSWPTFNIWNQDTVMKRIILLDNEIVNLSPNTVHCSKIDQAEKVLEEMGLL